MIGVWIWPLIIVASGAGTLLADTLPAPVGSIVVLWFLAICPGMALVKLLGLRDRLVDWVLALAVSLSLATIVATALVLASFWRPELGLHALVLVALVGAVAQLFRSAEDRR